MKGTVTLENGQVIEIEINEEQLKQMQAKKKTGYERVGEGDDYYLVKGHGRVEYLTEEMVDFDNEIYDIANYYSDPMVAVNNARADKLMRQLRRFAVENRETKINWDDCGQRKYYILYRHNDKELNWDFYQSTHQFGQIYFDSREAVKAAIKTFKDKLIWYFTEYKDSL